MRNSTVSAAAGSKLGPRADLYGELFRVPEFTALFVASSAQVAASTVTGLALGDAGVLVDRVAAAVGAGDVRPVARPGRGGVPAAVGGRPDPAPGRPHLAGADLRGGQLRAGAAGRRGGGDPRDRPRARRRVLARRRRPVRADERDPSARRLHARPVGAEHVGRHHADRRLRGRRGPGHRHVAARNAAGRRGLYVVSGDALPGRALATRGRAPRGGRRPRRPGGTTSCCSPRPPAATSTSGCACRTG